jgi:sialic acid synthase SpsE
MEPIFISELGLNHAGNFSKAMRMIELSKEAGATIVKFQHYNALDVLGRDHPALDYAASCQFTKDEHERLKVFCDSIKIEYLVSVFNIPDIKWADGLCKRHKIASRQNTNMEFLAHIDRCKKPTIMSIQDDTTLRSCYRDRFYFMWCVRNYPSTYQETLAHPFSYKYGLSSHCPDWNVIPDSYAKGARIFESHICESRKEEGCDISSSLTFDELKRAIDSVKTLERV